jgi:hypothetical protein
LSPAPVFPVLSPLLASSLSSLAGDTRDVRGALEFGSAVERVLAAQFWGQKIAHDGSFGLLLLFWVS